MTGPVVIYACGSWTPEQLELVAKLRAALLPSRWLRSYRLRMRRVRRRLNFADIRMIQP